jgi:group I intron endonuclease
MIVYKIENKLNGKQYIGQTIRALKERWIEHCKKTSDCSAIANAIQKYGKENFSIDILYTTNSVDMLNRKEQEFIKKFNTLRPKGYNLTTGGLNFIRSEETKRKLSERQKGDKNHMFGKKASSRTRRKMSISHFGERNHFYGKTHSKETKVKLSAYRKSQKCPRLGTKHTKQSKELMSRSHKGQGQKRIICHETNQVFDAIYLAAKAIGASPCTLSNALTGKIKTCKGYTFSYLPK